MPHSLEQDRSRRLVLFIVVFVLLLLQDSLAHEPFDTVCTDDDVRLDHLPADERDACLLFIHCLHTCPKPDRGAVLARRREQQRAYIRV
jgi:hypothetical protein